MWSAISKVESTLLLLSLMMLLTGLKVSQSVAMMYQGNSSTSTCTFGCHTNIDEERWIMECRDFIRPHSLWFCTSLQVIQMHVCSK
jgi:hypothetical protein